MKKVSNAVCPQCSGTINVWFDLNEWKGLPLDMRLINFRAIIG